MLLIGDMIHMAKVQPRMPAITVNYDAIEAEAAKTPIKTLAALARMHELVVAPHISFSALKWTAHLAGNIQAISSPQTPTQGQSARRKSLLSTDSETNRCSP